MNNQYFSVKSFEDILEHFNVLLKITHALKLKLEQFSDSLKRYIHSEKNLSQANDSHGIFYEKMITDLRVKLSF